MQASSHQDAQREARVEFLDAARARGWISLEEVLSAAAGSPVDLDEAKGLARDVGIELVDAEDVDAWSDLETLAVEGPEAFTAGQEAPSAADELLPGGPAALYLREISRTPLLTAAEEVELAQRLEAGKAAATRLAAGVGDADERARLEETVQIGDAARTRLIESNLRLVVSVAKKYLGRGLSFLDLVQEGNIGLQRGVDKFDWRRGFRFSTYVYWWIRQGVSRAVAEQSRTIRLPVHVIEQLTKLYNASRDLEIELGRRPTPAEIGGRLGLEPERVSDAFRAARVPISLETPIGDQDGSTVADLIADAATRAPAEEAEDEVLSQTLDRALRDQLSPREVQLLRLRYGLDRGGHERTLGEVGQELGISRERVRQLEAEIMTKLRRAGQLRQQFREYVE